MKKLLLFSFILCFFIQLISVAYETIIIDFPKGEKWNVVFYKKIGAEAILQYVPEGQTYNKWKQTIIVQSGKFEYLKGMLEQIVDEGHRVLLFSQFVDMLDIIKGWMDRVGIEYEYLTGKTKDRQKAVENFNNNPRVKVFLISLKAGGTGLNLTGADYVIHYDPWWNPAVEDQATDRAYRIGQTKKVFVYRIITKNTVEEKIQKLKTRKRDLVDSVISVDRNITKSLTMEDIKDIFSVD